MNSTTSTPSVDFHFSDAPDTHRESPPPLEQSELSYGLSPTNEKRAGVLQESTRARCSESVPQPTLRNSFFYQNVSSQEFFKEFESKFRVTLTQSSQSFGTALSIKSDVASQIKVEDLPAIGKENQIFNQISLSHREVSPQKNQGDHEIDLKIQADFRKCKKKENHPLNCFKKKSTHRKLVGLPGLHHVKSQRVTKKENSSVSLDLPQLDIDTPINPSFCFTSKATPRDNFIAKKIYEQVQRKKAHSLKMGQIFRKSTQKTNSGSSPGFAVEGVNLSLHRDQNKLKKSNIFVRLPQLR